ncbi:MAG TPA: lipopolysaccharide transport periplasmic protein LptA [Rhizomicrobium sp.]|nr:lipopolysaccharide transport periplasmic protein LptA [Rhizomicrobium sp.]
MKRALIALAFIAASPTFADDSPLNFGKQNTNQPIQVSSDSFLADVNAKTGTYMGNVIVTQGDFRLRADKVKVLVAAGKPQKILANGNVVLATNSGNAQGDNGVYDVPPRIVTLTGRVVLTKDKNVMRGTILVVNLITGAAKLNAQGAAGGGRVQGLFTPPPQQTQSTTPSTATENPPKTTP